MKRNGFTLLELLIALAVIGILLTVGVILLGTARERARDAKRLSDLEIVRSRLEEYFFNNNKYPSAPTAITLGTAGAKILCSGSSTGLAAVRTDCGNGTVYLDPVPTPPEPQPAALTGYVYTSPPPNNTYVLEAALEGALNGLQGVVQITPAGMKTKQ